MPETEHHIRKKTEVSKNTAGATTMIFKWEILRNRKYFNLNKFTELVTNVRKVIELSEIDIRDYEGNEPMTINHNQIWFNGNMNNFEHHETFSIRRIPKLNCVTEYGQCDTGNKPYTVVVAATLLLFKNYFKDQVSIEPKTVSPEWEKGYDLASQIIELGPLEELLQ